MQNAKMGLHLNVGYRLFGADGREKKIFQENAFFRFLLKRGIVSPHFVKVPFLLGHWTTDAHKPNLITNAGKALVAGLMTGDVTNFFDYIAVGTGTTAAAATDTALETESATAGLTRAASTNSRVTTDVTNDTAQFLKSFTVTGTVAVTESGVFDASSTGNMLCRQVFSAINVVNGDTLQITWKVDVD